MRRRSKILRKIFVFSLAFFPWIVCFANQGLGSLDVVRHRSVIEFRANGGFVLASDVLPGGAVWPWVIVDDFNDLNVGSVRLGIHRPFDLKKNRPGSIFIGEGFYVSEITKGAFSLHSDVGVCSIDYRRLGLSLGNRANALDYFKFRDIYLFAKGGYVYGLLRHERVAPSISSEYKTVKIDIRNCSFDFSESLGNPDLIVEYGSSERYFWLTGSIESTLLISRDGVTWGRVELPSMLYGLISAYVEDEKEIWLAAGYAGVDYKSKPMILKTDDGGKSWFVPFESFSDGSRVPAKWVEGLLRLNPSND
jgi:hypothetical protein